MIKNHVQFTGLPHKAALVGVSYNTDSYGSGFYSYLTTNLYIPVDSEGKSVALGVCGRTECVHEQ